MCSICGHPTDGDTHALFECPLVQQIWNNCGFITSLWAFRFQTLEDWIIHIISNLDLNYLRNFIVVLQELWNARNRFMFDNPDWNLSYVCNPITSFVKNYHLLHKYDATTSYLAPNLIDFFIWDIISISSYFDACVFGRLLREGIIRLAHL